MQELRAKVSSGQASQTEMLQKAQEICSQAEERAAGAERRADRAEERASKAEAELKVFTQSLQGPSTENAAVMFWPWRSHPLPLSTWWHEYHSLCSPRSLKRSIASVLADHTHSGGPSTILAAPSGHQVPL